MCKLLDGEISDLQEVLEKVMLDHPQDWEKYYAGSSGQQLFARRYSFSDRSRYYWPNPLVQEALERLITNLNQRPIPLTLLSQYLPLQYQRVRAGLLANNPRALILDRITSVLSDYAYACGFEATE